MRIRTAGAVVGAALLAAGLAGCGSEPAPTSSDIPTRTQSSSETPAEPTPSSSPAPTGLPIGTATMEVQGSGTATIRYRINGGAEQTETDATLPWSKDFPVYPEIESSVTAEGGTGCTITMQGMLVTFVPDPNPTCTFAYY